MTQPTFTITELDGALGVLPPSSGKLLALAGVSSSGPIDTPATYSKIPALRAAYGIGPLVEAAAHAIERYGRPVCVVRTGQTVVGVEGTLDSSAFTGTSVPTLDTTDPDDDFDIYVIFVTGGTIGTGGITYRYSTDGGRTLSPIQALGTANTITIPDTGGVNFDFGAGTVGIGSILRTRTTAPNFNAGELTAAMTALRNSTINWDILEIVGPLDGAAFDAAEVAIQGMAAVGKYKMWIGHTRMPNLAESEASYKTAMDTIFSGRASKHGSLCSGAIKLVSSVSGRQYRRPPSFVTAPKENSVSEEINIADVNLGPFAGVDIRDTNGNPDEHDESANPGLDDSRFTVMRTWDDFQGVYVNRPRIFSTTGSDFVLVPHRRVMNLTHGALRAYFSRRLNQPVRVNEETGFILEEEALEIEAGALSVMRTVLLGKPKASGIQFTLSRTDNLISTMTMTGQARVIPLAYAEFINLDVGFFNPALSLLAA